MRTCISSWSAVAELAQNWPWNSPKRVTRSSSSTRTATIFAASPTFTARPSSARVSTATYSLQAEATTADALAAVTSGDNTNILCARIARDHYSIKNVVARIYDPARADIYMKLGIPTVATSLWTTQQVKRWMLPSDDSIEWTDTANTMHLVERIVPDALAGKPVTNFNVGDSVRLVGIIRAGMVASTSKASSPRRTTSSSSSSPTTACEQLHDLLAGAPS